MMYVGDDFLNYYYLKSPMLRRDKLTKEDIDQSKRCYDFFTKSYKLTNKTKILEIGPGNGALLRYIYKKDKSKLYFSDLSKEASNVLEIFVIKSCIVNFICNYIKYNNCFF